MKSFISVLFNVLLLCILFASPGNCEKENNDKFLFGAWEAVVKEGDMPPVTVKMSWYPTSVGTQGQMSTDSEYFSGSIFRITNVIITPESKKVKFLWQKCGLMGWDNEIERNNSMEFQLALKKDKLIGEVIEVTDSYKFISTDYGLEYRDDTPGEKIGEPEAIEFKKTEEWDGKIRKIDMDSFVGVWILGSLHEHVGLILQKKGNELIGNILLIPNESECWSLSSSPISKVMHDGMNLKFFVSKINDSFNLDLNYIADGDKLVGQIIDMNEDGGIDGVYSAMFLRISSKIPNFSFHPEPSVVGGGEYTFEALCSKLFDTYKEIGIDTAQAESDKSICLMAADAWGDNPKATEAKETFVKTIMDACADKSGQDWLTCYAKNAYAAGEAAAKAAGFESQTIKIGALFSITGRNAPLGVPERDTVTMLQDKINESGGINGRKLELIIYDTEGDEDRTRTLVKKLIEEDNVISIIGISESGSTLTAMPEIEAAQIPYISCAASVRIVEPVNKWIFNTPQSDRLAMQKILEHIKATKPDITKIGMINADNYFGFDGNYELKRMAPDMGFELVSRKIYSADSDNAGTLAPVLNEMVQEGTQAIICWGTNPGTAHVTAAWQNSGLKAEGIPLYQSHGVANQTYIDLSESISKGSADGVLSPAGKLIVADQLPDSDPQKPLLLEFAKEFKAWYGKDADTFGGHAWDSLNIMVNAIATAGEDREQIRQAIEDTKNFNGISGVFNFSPENHNGLDSSAFVIVTVENGQWKLVHE